MYNYIQKILKRIKRKFAKPKFLKGTHTLFVINNGVKDTDSSDVRRNVLINFNKFICSNSIDVMYVSDKMFKLLLNANIAYDNEKMHTTFIYQTRDDNRNLVVCFIMKDIDRLAYEFGPKALHLMEDPITTIEDLYE